MAGLIGCAITLVVLVGILVLLGGAMFFGEWLLGSLGWGVLHGALLFTGFALALVMGALGYSAGRLAGWFLLALLLGIGAALVFGLHLLNRAYGAIGDAALPNVDAANRPLIAGMLVVGLIGIVLGVVLFLRAAGAQAFRERPGGTIVNLILVIILSFLLGALVGAFTSITFGWRPAVGLGLTLAYTLWIVFLVVDLFRTGIDDEALKERFYPTQTIETTKETLEWLQRRMPGGSGS
jgi:MFS family permease